MFIDNGLIDRSSQMCVNWVGGFFVGVFLGPEEEKKTESHPISSENANECDCRWIWWACAMDDEKETTTF